LSGLETLLEVAGAFARLGAPWYVSGGWAIDLHLGRVTREHHDVDVLVLRRDQAPVRETLSAWTLRKIVPHPEVEFNRGAPLPWTLAEWPVGERLELPVHQVNAYRSPAEVALDAMPYFQVMLAESSGGQWLYRRNPAVRRPLDALGYHSMLNLPYFAPELVLLFKSKHMRDYDREDFDNVLPLLTADARRFLHDALELCIPGHEWIARL
jgi:Aminoglycoside-2''-adenylyltransferase